MTNDPSSGQSGGGPPEERPAGTPPSSGMGDSGDMARMSEGSSVPESSGEPTRDFSSSAPPPSPPPPSGGYTPPASGYTPPPPESGATYTPSSSGGDYTPPPTPPPSGGYTPPPPPSGGYTPPPGGGYAAPPPPPTSRPETGGAMDLGSLVQSYINAVTKPNASTYEAEIPRADWTKTLIGVAAVAVVNFIVALIGIGSTAAFLNQFRDQFQQEGVPIDPGMFAGAGVGGAFSSLFFTFIGFFLGAGLLWLMARVFGGQNSDFMTHSYLLSLSYTPLRIAGAVIGIIPILGGFIAILLSLYQLYSAGLAMQASQRMAPGRAQMAAFLPTIVGFALTCLCLIIFFGALFAAITGAATNP
jgi:hypothetical protein